jgi:hypothetical protein
VEGEIGVGDHFGAAFLKKAILKSFSFLQCIDTEYSVGSDLWFCWEFLDIENIST